MTSLVVPEPTKRGVGIDVSVVRVLDPLDPVGSREVHVEPWRPGLTIRGLLTQRELELDEDFLSVARAGEVVGRERWDEQLAPQDVVVIAHLPGGPLGAIVAKYLIYAIISAAVSFLVSKLFAPPGAAHTPEDNESGTYGWSGLRSIYNSNGQAIPVVYGEHRTGGLVISQWVQSTLTADALGVITDAESTLRVLLLLSVGPIESIGGYTTDQDDLAGGDLPVGLQIEGNDAANYQNVKAWTRLGTLTQASIPGFEAVRTFIPVGLLIDQETADSGLPAVVDWSKAVGYDMTTAADSVVLGFLFPFGLYTLSGSALATEEVELEVRYQELDSGGLPIGPWATPAFFDDGTPNPIKIQGALQGEFVKQLPLTFFDPSTFVPQTLGQALLARKTKGYLERSDLDGLNVGWGPSEEVLEFSIELSYKYFIGVTAGAGSGDERVLLGWIQAPLGTDSTGSYLVSALRGISLKWTDGNPSSTQDDVGLEIELGYGSNTSQGHYAGWNRYIVSGLFSVTTGTQLKTGQLTVTYKGGGQQRTLTIYHDGVQVAQFTGFGTSGGASSLPRLRAPSTGNKFYLGSADQMAASASGTFYDQVRVLKRILTPAEVAAAWNGGAPVGAAILGPAADKLVALWSMNSTDFVGMSGGGTPTDPYYGGTLTDKSTNGLDLSVTSLGATPGTGVEAANGWVYDGLLVGSSKRGRFRIQAQRLDVVQDDTDTKDVVKFDHVITVDDHALIYPESALLGVEVVGDDQLNSQRPSITCPIKGRRLRIWDGADPENPTFSVAWSASPAWVLLDAITAKYGLGSVYNVDSVGLVSLKNLADYAADLVSDLKPVQAVREVVYGTWSSGSELDVLYPDGYCELRGSLIFGEAWPVHLAKLEKDVELTGTVGAGAPAWAQDLLDSGTHKVVEIEVDTLSGVPGDAIRIPWPSSAIPVPPSPTAWDMGTTSSTLDVEGREERLRCDIVLDRGTEKAWDQLLKLANAGRSVPVKLGNRIRVKTEQPRSAVQVFNSSNIVQGSFKISAKGRSEAFNAATMEILDRDQNWERVVVELQHSSLQDETKAQNVRRKSFSAEGVTRRSQAVRELRILLNSAYLVRAVIEFETEHDATFVESGDVILVAHDLPLWAFSGRCLVSTEAADSIVIDRPVTLAAATTYYCAVRNGSTDDIETVQVSSPAGSYEAGERISLSSSLTFVPKRLDLWTIGQTVASAKLFQVTERTLSNDLHSVIKAMEYDDGVFDATGFPELANPVSELPVPTETEMGTEFSVVLGDGSGADEDTGIYTKAINVSWTYPARTSANVAQSAIWLAELAQDSDGTPPGPGAYRIVGYVDGRARSYSVTDRSLRLGRLYSVKVQPIGRRGQRPTLARLGGATVHLRGRSDSIVPPDSAGLLVKGGMGYYTVDQPFDGGRGVAAEFRRGGWLLGQRVLSLGAASEVGAATHDWTYTAGGGVTTPAVFCRNRYQSGQHTPAVVVTTVLDKDGQIKDEIVQDDVEVTGWTAGGATLTGLAVNSDGDLEFSGSALSATWESRVYDMTATILLSRMTHLSVDCLADQSHPRAWETFAKLTSGAKGVEGEVQAVLGTPFFGGQSMVKGAGLPQGGFRDAWGGAWGKQWTWEGPMESIDGESSEVCTLTLEIRTSRIGTPSGAYEEYRPGRYWCRSFQVKLTVTRPDTTYDVRITRMGITAQTLREDIVDGGQSTSAARFIFFRRDTWNSMKAYSPSDGEPLWVNDHKRFFIGDGALGTFIGCALVFHSLETDGANYGALATVLWKSDLQKGPEITHSTSSNQDEITFAVTGFYVLCFQLFGISSGGGVSLEGIIYLDTGSGYAPINASQGAADFSAATRRGCATATVPLAVTTGDKIKVWARGIGGSGSVNLTASQSSLTIYRMSEAQP